VTGVGTRTKAVLLLVKGLGRGGAERIVVDSVRSGHARFRYDVAYVRRDKDALVAELRGAGADVRRLQPFRAARELRHVVRDREIDVIHAHSPILAVAARIALPETPLVYTEHNEWSRYRTPTYLANLLTYGSNDHVLAVSDAVRASIRYPRGLRWRHMPPVETLYHGPSLDTLAHTASTADDPRVASEGARTIACVANFKVHKGHPTLIRAFAKVRANAPDAHLVLVGVGQTEGAVRSQVAELGLGEAVTFAGRRDDVPAILSRADAFVLASDHEGLPLSLLEAMALGTPAVVTRVGGIPEVVRDGEAIVVPPRDVDALADGILQVLGDGGLARSLVEAGKRRARDFDIRTAVRRMEEVYEELLA
jgi:glycosyltransferase involved in cell wall biosynthesis